MKTINITIDHLTKEGVGVARIDKKPCYVKYALPLENMDINIEYEGKRNIYGNIKEIKNPLDIRSLPKCSVYYKCGGCHLSHINYQAQLEFKRDLVKKLYKNGGFDINVHDCVGQETPYFYRNKVQTPVGYRKGKIVAGFYKEETHDIIPFDNCLVQDEYSNKVIKEVINAMVECKIKPYDEDKQTGVVRHLLVKRSVNETMLVLITKQDSFEGRNNFVKAIKRRLPELTTIIQNINKRVTNVILGEKENILYGKGYITDTLLGVTFKISPKSFYQINKHQCEKLYSKAIELAKLNKDDIILDAYCGIGTIGMIASNKVNKVYGVEIVEDAIIDAKKNAKDNNINNCYFYCDDAKDFIRKYKGTLDVVFVDPPRKGCSKEFLQAIIKFKPKKLIYISCNPETQVEDVKFLTANGYTFNDVYPFDMFPQTYHIETVVFMSLK